MKNQNLFEFQNGMAYVFSTLNFDSAIPVMEPSYIPTYFEIEDNLIIPKNPDNWNVWRDRMNNVDWNPSIVRNDMLNNYYYTWSGVTFQIVDEILCHPSTNSNAQGEKEFVPIFIRTEFEIKRIYMKYQFTGWTGALRYWDVGFGYLSTSATENENEFRVENEKNYITRLADYGDTNVYEISIDVDANDNVDFLIFRAVDGYLKILEIGFEYE